MKRKNCNGRMCRKVIFKRKTADRLEGEKKYMDWTEPFRGRINCDEAVEVCFETVAFSSSKVIFKELDLDFSAGQESKGNNHQRRGYTMVDVAISCRAG